MDDSQFWAAIAAIDRQALDAGDEAAAVAPLVEALTRLAESDIEAFSEHLSRALFAIDGRVYADNAGLSGGSDDGFLYCRCYVVARGKGHYEEVRADPGLMPKDVASWCESLLYAPSRAWARRTGRDAEEWSFEPSVSYESGSNADLWS